MSLQLDYMKRALADVQGVRDHQGRTDQKSYGALCHQVPVFVLTHGLAITATFVDAKAAGESGTGPYKLMQRHLIGALNGSQKDQRLSDVLNRRQGAATYMLDTFTILDAWVYYKRFAVSILDVDATERDAPMEIAPDATERAQPVAAGEG